MLAILGIVTRLIGWGGVAFVALALYVFGIPGASRIPFLPSIPIVGDIVAGRMATYAADQVKLEKQGFEREKDQLVSKFELSATKAALEKERALRASADLALSESRKRNDIAVAQAQARAEEIERLRGIADKDPDLSKPNERDIQWLKEHSLR